MIEYRSEIARDPADANLPLISADTLVVIDIPRGGGSAGEANVTLRGISPAGLALRPQVALVAGRWFVPENARSW